MNSEKLGIIRIPTETEKRDASAQDVNNLIDLSIPIFDNIVVFDDRFQREEEKVCSINVEKSHRQNIIFRILSHFAFQLRLCIRILEQRELDVLIWHAGGYSLLLPMVFCKLLRIKMITCVIGNPVEGHSEDFWGISSHFLPWIIMVLEISAFTLSDGIIVLSSDNETLKRFDNFESNTYRLWFNYIDVPDDIVKYTNRENKITYVGRVCELKGTNLLIDAVSTLESSPENPEFIFQVVGDGELLNQLQSRVEAESMEDTVKFSGWVDHEDVISHLESSRIFVLPSNSEGLPKSLQEAMAFGAVPITTPVGSIPELVSSGENGILIPTESPDELARAISELLENPDRAQSMSQAAQNTIRGELSYHTVSKKYSAIISDVLGQ